MSRTKVKICGITTLADARYCAGAGVDYLGFIQYEKSPRYIPPEEAREIIAWLYGPECVGVFVNRPADAVNRIVEESGFHAAQIHGDFLPEEISEIRCKTIYALPVSENTTADDLKHKMDAYRDAVDFFLLDTARAGLYGGTGETFNWDVALPLTASYPVFIAGGLNPANIGEAIRKLRPFGVDIASGVEQSPGVKDFDKLAALFDILDSLHAPERN